MGLLFQADVVLARRTGEMPDFGKQVILSKPAPNGDDLQIVHEAIKVAAITREWDVLEDTPRKLRLHLSVQDGKHQMTIDVGIEKDYVTITYVDSVNLNYAKKSDGTETIHPNYTKWIDTMLKAARTYALKKVQPDAKTEPESNLKVKPE